MIFQLFFHEFFRCRCDAFADIFPLRFLPCRSSYTISLISMPSPFIFFQAYAIDIFAFSMPPSTARRRHQIFFFIFSRSFRLSDAYFTMFSRCRGFRRAFRLSGVSICMIRYSRACAFFRYDAVFFFRCRFSNIAQPRARCRTSHHADISPADVSMPLAAALSTQC